MGALSTERVPIYAETPQDAERLGVARTRIHPLPSSNLRGFGVDTKMIVVSVVCVRKGQDEICCFLPTGYGVFLRIQDWHEQIELDILICREQGPSMIVGSSVIRTDFDLDGFKVV